MCGLVPDVEAPTSPVVLCGRTCRREAAAELPRLVGRVHQLEQLQQRSREARPWQLVLHPASRRDVAGAELEVATLLARVELLERAIAVWDEHDQPPPPRTLGPRPAATASRDGHVVDLTRLDADDDRARPARIGQ